MSARAVSKQDENSSGGAVTCACGVRRGVMGPRKSEPERTAHLSGGHMQNGSHATELGTTVRGPEVVCLFVCIASVSLRVQSVSLHVCGLTRNHERCESSCVSCTDSSLASLHASWTPPPRNPVQAIRISVPGMQWVATGCAGEQRNLDSNSRGDGYMQLQKFPLRTSNAREYRSVPAHRVQT